MFVSEVVVVVVPAISIDFIEVLLVGRSCIDSEKVVV